MISNRSKAAPKLAFLVLTVLCASCNPSPGYREFVRHKQDFYIKLAAECDGLLPQAPVTGAAESRRLAQDTNSLPPLVKALNPDRVIVDTNVVHLRIGTGMISYGIVWHSKDEDPSLWILSAYTEGSSQDVYSRRRSAQERTTGGANR